MHHQRWVGRAFEQCLDDTSSVGGGARAHPRTPPPRDALQCALAGAFSVRWQGPDTVCVGRTPTCVRSKKYMEKVCNGFLINEKNTCRSISRSGSAVTSFRVHVFAAGG